MVTTMLDKAFAKIPDNTNLILHSDQGWQYQWMLREKGYPSKHEPEGQLFRQRCD